MAVGFGFAILITLVLVVICSQRSVSYLMAFENLRSNGAPVRQPFRVVNDYRLARKHSSSRASFLAIAGFASGKLPGFSGSAVEMVGVDVDVDPAESNLSALVHGMPASDGAPPPDGCLHETERALQRALGTVEVLKVGVGGRADMGFGCICFRFKRHWLLVSNRASTYGSTDFRDQWY